MLRQKKERKMRTVIVFCATALLLLFSSIHTALADFVMPEAPVGAPENFDSAILNATNWILGFVGALAVLALIWGGISYLTSAGDEERARTGKQTIKYALMGLVIAGIAYALVSVVVSTVLG